MTWTYRPIIAERSWATKRIRSPVRGVEFEVELEVLPWRKGRLLAWGLQLIMNGVASFLNREIGKLLSRLGMVIDMDRFLEEE